MPRVAVLDGVRIEFYANEHPPAHFHAIFAEHRAVFDIVSLGMIAGSFPRAKEHAVRQWASTRRVELLRAWAALRDGRAPGTIE